MKTIIKEDILKDLAQLKPDNSKMGTIQLHERACRRASKILYLYFKYLYEILLEKKKFEIVNFGCLELQKKLVNPTQLKATPGYYHLEERLENNRVLNKRMIGEVVTITFTSGYPVEHKIRFKACKSFRKSLTKLLYETDFGKTIALCQ